MDQTAYRDQDEKGPRNPDGDGWTAITCRVGRDGSTSATAHDPTPIRRVCVRCLSHPEATSSPDPSGDQAIARSQSGRNKFRFSVVNAPSDLVGWQGARPIGIAYEWRLPDGALQSRPPVTL